jgi:CBS-domain-containing membrane protein
MRDRQRRAPGDGKHPLGLTVGSLMSSPPVVVQSESTSADALHQLEHQSHDTYPVIGHDGRAIGLLRARELERERHESYATLVQELTDADQELLVESWVDAGLLLDSSAFRRAGHAVVVNREGRAVGIISDSDIRHAIRRTEFTELEQSEAALVALRVS